MVLKFGVLGELYFGWPNQSSSGTMRIYTGRCVYIDHDSFVNRRERGRGGGAAGPPICYWRY